MNRTTKIIVYAVLLLFVFLGFTTIYKSWKKQNSDPTEENLDITSEDNFSDSEAEDDFFDQIDDTAVAEDGENTDYNTVDESSETSDDVIGNQVSLEEDSYEAPAQTQRNEPQSNPARTTNNSARFMVLAGSYLLRENAVNMQRKLSGMGYNNAEIVIFDLSQYHTVCATRSNSYESAVEVSNDLKRRGIDSYVHRKQ